MSSTIETKPFENIVIRSGHIRLTGILRIPISALGVVLFAHGSGSGRFSPRNNFVARQLQEASLATLIIDLLDPKESEDRRKIFDIDLLANRLLLGKAWLMRDPRTAHLKIGYFGASTGTGAALQAAAREPGSIAAVVSRGGRPDLAQAYLSRVSAPTLLIVGGDDEPVIDMNREAYTQLHCEKDLVIVPGATHLFEESGTLEQVAHEACEWFRRYFSAPVSRSTDASGKEPA
jgi:putative phosphoribosyl transferase